MERRGSVFVFLSADVSLRNVYVGVPRAKRGVRSLPRRVGPDFLDVRNWDALFSVRVRKLSRIKALCAWCRQWVLLITFL